MDNTTRDIYALLNAHNLLLKALYIELAITRPLVFDELEARVMAKLQAPVAPLGDPEELHPIRHQTGDAVRLFFREIRAAG